tara:strand:+ start:298 stop:543 length:246 start_codon:yes stop_codon:yes gene_type:complete
MSEENIGSDANLASDTLNNEIFNKAFVAMNNDLVNRILNTPEESTKEREQLYYLYKGGQQFVQQFVAMINRFELDKKTEEV